MSNSSKSLISSYKLSFQANPFVTPPWLQDLPVFGIIASTLVIYLSIVRFLRFRAVKKLQEEYAEHIPKPYAMSYKTAHSILKLGLLSDFPFLHAFSTQWALVKTYGIASGTPLLALTGRLTQDAQVGKRAEDTSIFITEFLAGDQDSERGRRALAKVNWIHARYGKKITKTEMMYTLSVFVLEPIRWMKMYEWREMTELESVALFVYWKEIGSRMGIPNIPDTLEGLQAWAERFEETDMYYVKENSLCAEATISLFLRGVPVPLRRFARKLVLTFMEPKVRKAVGCEDPPVWAERFVTLVFSARAWAIRNLFLPRRHPINPLPTPEKDGRIRREPHLFMFEPWYVKDTLWSTLMVCLHSWGRLIPGPKYNSEGYYVEEVGPAEFKMASKEAVRKEADAIKLYAEKGGAAVIGCPFQLGR